jgi:hypothetical protein
MFDKLRCALTGDEPEVFHRVRVCELPLTECVGGTGFSSVPADDLYRG